MATNNVISTTDADGSGVDHQQTTPVVSGTRNDNDVDGDDSRQEQEEQQATEGGRAIRIRVQPLPSCRDPHRRV